jgi:nucleotide-binding universal stress UspA family protein
MSTPRSILLHIDSSAHTAARIRLARQLAEAFDAEVIGQPCMLSSMVRYPFALEGASAAIALMQEFDQACLDKARAGFLKEAAGSSRLQWAEPLVDGPHGFARRALCADLMVLGQRDEDDPAVGELPADFLPGVLVQSGRPALVLPHAVNVAPLGGQVLVAWKETREAARAVSAALPWLQRARQVHVLSYGEEADASLRSIERYLKAHGVAATCHDGGPELGDAGNQVLSRAADLGADLLVMGCYGHSRAREWVLGGVTRTLLQSMTLPVLMSH